jgi:hypothetical protein
MEFIAADLPFYNRLSNGIAEPMVTVCVAVIVDAGPDNPQAFPANLYSQITSCARHTKLTLPAGRFDFHSLSQVSGTDLTVRIL